jgi:hypothetical protein
VHRRHHSILYPIFVESFNIAARRRTNGRFSFEEMLSMRNRWFTRDRIITIFLIAIIILLALGIINQKRLPGFNLFRSSTTIAEVQSSSNVPVISSTTPYTAEVPGPGCDHHGALWRGGNMRHEKNSDVDDPNTSFVCRKDGLLIIRFTPYYVFGAAFFEDPTGTPLSNNYRVQVTARVMHGDPNATVALSVHGQSRYGSDSISVSSDGRWLEETFNNTTASRMNTLASGTLAQPPSTITIVAEVHGASVSATINGTHIKMVKDPDYSTTSYISIGVADSGAANSPEALFSHFVYTPL